MNKFLDWIISIFEYISKKNKLYLTAFYNKTSFTINRNFELKKIYKPIIDEKVMINKKLQEALNIVYSKNKEAEKNILKLENENALLQAKINIIEDLITQRHN